VCAVISVSCSALGIILAFLIDNMPIGPCVVMVNLVLYIALTLVGRVKTGK